MKEFATPAMSAPVTLTVEDREVEISPATLGKHLTMNPDGETGWPPRSTPRGSWLILRWRVRSRWPPTRRSTRSCAWTAGSGGGLDGKAGQEVTAEALKRAVLPLLTGTGTARTGALDTEKVEPELTRDNVGRLGIKEKMSTFTVNFEPTPTASRTSAAPPN